MSKLVRFPPHIWKGHSQLLIPETLQADTIDAILSNHFANSPDVLFINIKATDLFLNYLTHPDSSPLQDQTCQEQLLSLFNIKNRCKWILFAFQDANHFMGVTLHYDET